MIEINSIRNQRLSSIFYMEIAEILMKDETKKGFLITLIKIRMTPDLSLIKNYISIYPFLDKELLESIRSKSGFYRKLLSKKLRYRVKKIPELDFCVVNYRK
ncbi:ribosome-binding factor A [Blattabacterium cuenoti]|uniref:ribosome-binding factor A n=1 Tax=Blattabacterium cuenoti TaxID=1653831 RepID=UPI00163D1F8E|nr:ribosome-binding factor A [Blattabacterium cuenoti]